MSEFKFKVRGTVDSEMLGSQPADDEVFQTYIASKNPDENAKESLNVEDLEEKGTTIFNRDTEGRLCLMDYQLKGFLKSRGNVIRARTGGGKGNPWAAVKGKIDDHVFVYPRFVQLHRDGAAIKEAEGVCERPLSAQTAQGPRVCLARSEAVAPGATFEFEIEVAGVIQKKQIREILAEGRRFGLGSWRNSGKGRVSFEIVDEE